MSTTVDTRVVDYRGAARRHAADADLLLAQGRLPNAGQLYGFAAECGLKWMIKECGALVGPDNGFPRKSRYRQHLPRLIDLLDEMENLANGRYASHFLAYLHDVDDLADWDIDDRYRAEGDVNLASVPAWQNAVRQVLAALDAGLPEGDLT